MKLLKIEGKEKEQIINKFVEELKDRLDKNNNTNGTFRFAFELNGKLEKKRKLYISPTAYIKMLLLVYNYDSEIGWYGTAERSEDDEYKIEDVFVYPQTVTGATVDTDEEEFKAWLDGLSDEVFNKLRFNGHSHVNMAVEPSGVDMAGRESDLNSLRENDFQIFMIMNKRRDFTVSIYDRRDNAIYETDDVEIYITGCVQDTFKILEDSRKVVGKKTYTSYPTASNPKSYTPPAEKKEQKKASGKKDSKKIFGSRYLYDDDDDDIEGYVNGYNNSYYNYSNYGYY